MLTLQDIAKFVGEDARPGEPDIAPCVDIGSEDFIRLQKEFSCDLYSDKFAANNGFRIENYYDECEMSLCVNLNPSKSSSQTRVKFMDDEGNINDVRISK